MHRFTSQSRKSPQNQIDHAVEKGSPIQSVFITLIHFCYHLGLFSVVAVRKLAHTASAVFSPFIRLVRRAASRIASFAERCFGRSICRAADILRRTGRGVRFVFRESGEVLRKEGILRGVGAFFGLTGRAAGRHKRFLYRSLRGTAPVLAMAVLVATIGIWSSATFALQVHYDGEPVGYVTDESVFADAYELMKLRVVDDGTDSFQLKTPQYTMAMVSADQVLDAAALCDSLITASCDEISEACGLYVDGELITVTPDKASLQSVLDGILTAYREDPQVVDASFANDILYKEGLYPVESIVSEEMAQVILTQTHDEIDAYTVAAGEASPVSQGAEDSYDALADGVQGENPPISREITAGSAVRMETDASVLNVKLVRTETYDEAIAFESEEIQDSSKLEGYRKVTVEGAEGVKQVTANVEYVDGQEVSRQIMEENVVTEPIKEQIVVGTRSIAAASRKTVTMRQLMWPVANVSGSYISSYFGDGRNHKGLDISAPSGTPIYAAEGGTVVSVNGSGWGYGLHFVIDHGNGVQTLYSHCSSMQVEVGQQVVRGQQIAAVGRTGNATGNHLHFEVRVGGTPYNPAPFLGLN